MTEGLFKHEFETAPGVEHTALVGADGVMTLHPCGVMDVPAVAAALKTAHDCGFEAAALLAASERLRVGRYLDWGAAGGPDECQHGVAAGIACRACDQALVEGASGGR